MQSEAQTENCSIKKLSISNMYNLRMNILKTWNIYMALTVKYSLFSACVWKIRATKGEMSFPLGCDTMWRHKVSLKWPLIRYLSVNLVAGILMVNINYFYNSDDEKLVITLHEKWGPIIYRLVLKLKVIFMPKTVT
jgi:hypothetical protein